MDERARTRGAGWLRVGLAIVLVGKLALVGVWVGRALASGGGAAKPAAAPQGAPGGSAESTAPAPATDVRDLLEGVQRRQAELDAREQELDARAEQLHLLEQDVTAKIATLEAIEKRLAGEAKTRRAVESQAAESLAKIYGAMKPAEAAPILDQLDDETILTIFTRMKEKQIGEILPLMTRERAIGLTQSLASRR
jgi:flagellar protein FlbB